MNLSNIKSETLQLMLDVARNEGDFDAVNEIELAMTHQREERYQQWWQDRFDDDTADLY